MTDYDNTNRGALFTNDKQGKPNRPDLRGSLNVEGREYWISGWNKTGKKGDFVSLSVEAKDAAPEGHPDRFKREAPVNSQKPTGFPEKPRQVREEDLDDSIPF